MLIKVSEELMINTDYIAAVFLRTSDKTDPLIITMADHKTTYHLSKEESPSFLTGLKRSEQCL